MDQIVAPGPPTILRGPLVSVDHVRHYYGDGDVLVLDDVNVTLGDNEIVALLGRSGSGKSTLLRIIAGLMPPAAGTVTIAGVPVDGPAGDVAMVFQSFALFPWLTVLENVEIGLEAQGMGADERRKRAVHANCVRQRVVQEFVTSKLNDVLLEATADIDRHGAPSCLLMKRYNPVRRGGGTWSQPALPTGVRAAIHACWAWSQWKR